MNERILWLLGIQTIKHKVASILIDHLNKH